MNRIERCEELQRAGASLTDILTLLTQEGDQLLEDSTAYLLAHGHPSETLDAQVLEIFQYILALTQTALLLPSTLH
jgi:hypothetical protein